MKERNVLKEGKEMGHKNVTSEHMYQMMNSRKRLELASGPILGIDFQLDEDIGSIHSNPQNRLNIVNKKLHFHQAVCLASSESISPSPKNGDNSI